MSISFFFVGVSYAIYIEAGKDQMLAGGAIVLGYGVVASFIALVLAIFIASKARRQLIFRLNIFLASAIIAFWSYYYMKYQEQKKAKEQEEFRILDNS